MDDLRSLSESLSTNQLRLLRDKLPKDSRGLVDWIALRREGEDEVSPVEVILLQRAASRAHFAPAEPLCTTARHIVDGLSSTLVPRQLALLHESVAKLLPAERRVVRAQLCGVLAGVSASRCTRRSERWAQTYDEKFAAFEQRAPALTVSDPTLAELDERRATFGTDDVALEAVRSVMIQENIDAHRGRMADHYGDKRASLEINCFLEGAPTLALTASMETAVERAEASPAIPANNPRILKVRSNLRKLRVVLANNSYDDPAYRKHALDSTASESGGGTGSKALKRLESLELKRLTKRIEKSGGAQRGEPQSWEAWEERKSHDRRAEATLRAGGATAEQRAAAGGRKRRQTEARTAIWRARKNNFLRACDLLYTLDVKRARSSYETLAEGEKEGWERVARELACVERAQEPAMSEAVAAGLVVDGNLGRGGSDVARDPTASPVKRAAAASAVGGTVRPWSLRKTWMSWMKQHGSLSQIIITEAEFSALTASQQEHLVTALQQDMKRQGIAITTEDENGDPVFTEGVKFVALGYTSRTTGGGGGGGAAASKTSGSRKKKKGGRGSKPKVLSGDEKLKNSVCVRVWAKAWSAIVEGAKARKVKKGGKKSTSEPVVLSDPVAVSRYGMQQLRMMSERDQKARAEAKEEETVERRVDGRRAHLGFIKRKESLRLRLGSGAAGGGGGAHASKITETAPRMNFMSGTSMVVARPKRGIVPQLEQTIEMAVKLGMTEIHAKNAEEYSTARELQRKMRSEAKKASAPSDLAQSRFDRWRSRKAVNEKALRYVESIPHPAEADPEHTWRDVGQSMKLIDPEGSFLGHWIEWTQGYRTRAQCTAAWQKFEPQLCDGNFLAIDADVTKEAMRSMLLRGHGKHADFVAAFEGAFRDSWNSGRVCSEDWSPESSSERVSKGELCKPPSAETQRRFPDKTRWQAGEQWAFQQIAEQLESGEASISARHFNRMLVRMGVEMRREQLGVLIAAIMQPRKKRSPRKKKRKKGRRGGGGASKSSSAATNRDFSDDSDDNGFESEDEEEAMSSSSPARRDAAFPATKAAGLDKSSAAKAPKTVKMVKLIAFVEGSLAKATKLDQSKQRDAMLRLEQLSAAGRARKQIRERRQQGKPPVAPVLSRGSKVSGGAASKVDESGATPTAAAAVAATGEENDDATISLKWRVAKGSPPVAFFVLQHGGAEGSPEQKRNEWCTLMMDPDRATDPPTPPCLACILSELLYNDGSKRVVLPGTTYCFRLRAYNDHGASPWAFLSLTTQHPSPLGLSLKWRTYDSISLEWSSEEYTQRLLDAFLRRFGNLARRNLDDLPRSGSGGRGTTLTGEYRPTIDPSLDPTLTRRGLGNDALALNGGTGRTGGSVASFIRREQLVDLYHDEDDPHNKVLKDLRSFLAGQPANDGSTRAEEQRTVLEMMKDVSTSRGGDDRISQADIIEWFRNRKLFSRWVAARGGGRGGAASAAPIRGGGGGTRPASSKGDERRRGRKKTKKVAASSKSKDLGNATSPTKETYFILENCIDELRDVWVSLYKGITPSITLRNLDPGSRMRLRVRVNTEEFFSTEDDEKDKTKRKILEGRASESMVVCLRLQTPHTPLLQSVSPVHVALRWPDAALVVNANVTLAVARQKKGPTRGKQGSGAMVVRAAGQEIDSRSVFIRNTPALVKSWVGVAAPSASGGGGVNIKANFDAHANEHGDLTRDDLRDLLRALDAPGGGEDKMDYLAYHIAEIELLGGDGPDVASPRAAASLLSSWRWDHDRDDGGITWPGFSKWWIAGAHYFVVQRTIPLPALHAKCTVGLESFVQDKSNAGVASTRELSKLYGAGAKQWKSLLEDDAACDEAIESGKSTGRDITGLPPNTLVGFRMRVVIASTFSQWSPPVYVFTPPRSLDRPVVVARGDRWAFLRWYRKDVGIAQYVVEQCDGDRDGGPWTCVWKGARSGALKATLVAKITRLTPNTPYQFRVRAVNRGGRPSDPSPSVSLTTVFTKEAARAVTVPRNALSRGHFDVSCGTDIVMGDTIIFTELCYRKERGYGGGGRGGGRGAAAGAMGHRVGGARVVAGSGMISRQTESMIEVFVCERTIAVTVEGETYSRSRRRVRGNPEEGPIPDEGKIARRETVVGWWWTCLCLSVKLVALYPLTTSRSFSLSLRSLSRTADDRRVLPLDDLFELGDDALPTDTPPSPARRELRMQVLWCTTSHQVSICIPTAVSSCLFLLSIAFALI